MTSDMEKLTKLVGTILQKQQLPNKKRKLNQYSSPQLPNSVVSNTTAAMAFAPNETFATMPETGPRNIPSNSTTLTDKLVQFEHVDAQLAASLPSATNTDYESTIPAVAPCPPPAAMPATRQDSIGFGSIGLHEEDLFANLFSSDPMEEIRILEGTDSGVPDSIRPIADVSPYLMDTLRNALANLPSEMQEMFVDRTVAAIAQPDKFEHQIEALTSLSVSAAEEAKRRLAQVGKDPSDPKMLPIASAVLGAYLARFSGQKQAFEETQKQSAAQGSTGAAHFMQM